MRHTLIVIIVALASLKAFAQDTTVVANQVYGHRDGMALYYDVEIPANPNGLGIVFVVSGGFVSGPDNLNISKPFWNVLLENGYTLFEIYHPGMPKFRIPDAFIALQQGVSHIQANSAAFGVDSTRLGVFGISSGGHLALLLGLSVDPLLRSDNDFKAIVALMPIVDVRNVGVDEELFGARFLDFDPALIPSVSPVDYVTADDPPTLMVHGTNDQAVDFEENSLRLQGILDSVGVDNRLLPIDAGHEVFPGPLMLETHQAMVQWFDQHLQR